MRTGIIVLSLLAVVALAQASVVVPPVICEKATDGIVQLLPGTPANPEDRGITSVDCFRFNLIHTANQSSPMTGDNWDPLETKLGGSWNFRTGRFRVTMFDDVYTYSLSSDNLLVGDADGDHLNVGGTITISSPNLDAEFTCLPTLFLDDKGSRCMHSNGVWGRHLSLWCGDTPNTDFAGITLGIDFRFDLGNCETFTPDDTCAMWHATEGASCGLNLAYNPSKDEFPCGNGDSCIAACCVPDLCPESTSTVLTLRPVGAPSEETHVKASESQIPGLDDCFNWNLLHTATVEDPILGNDIYNYAVTGGSWDYATGAFSAKLIGEDVREDAEEGVSSWTFSGSLLPATDEEGILKRLVSGSLTLAKDGSDESYPITCHAELYDETWYTTSPACMRSNTYLDNYISLWCGDTEAEDFTGITAAIDFRFAWTCDACKPYRVDCGCKKVVLPAGRGDGCNCLEFRSKEESNRNGQIDCTPVQDDRDL